MLELEEMRQIWAKHDRTLEESVRLNRRLLSTANLGRARTSMGRISFSLTLRAVVCFVAIVALGMFIHEHRSVPTLLLSGIAVDIFAIGMVAATIGQLIAVQAIDYGEPVATIQKRLGALRVYRVRTVQFGLLGGTIVWAPLLVVIGKAFLGIDRMNSIWLLGNVIFGLILIPLSLWLSKRFGDSAGRSPFVQRLMRDIAGRNLNDATAFLEELSDFARD